MGVDLDIRHVIGIKIDVNDALYEYRDTIAKTIENAGLRLYYETTEKVPFYIIGLKDAIFEHYYFTGSDLTWDKTNPDFKGLGHILKGEERVGNGFRPCFCKADFWAKSRECILAAWDCEVLEENGIPYLDESDVANFVKVCDLYFPIPVDESSQGLPLDVVLPLEIRTKIYKENIHLYKFRHFSY